jgi:hypothetical protein
MSFAEEDKSRMIVVIPSTVESKRPLVLTMGSTVVEIKDPALELVFNDAARLESLTVSYFCCTD